MLARESTREEPLRGLPRRQGSVLAAVTSVLELAGKSMAVSEIHEAVERALGGSVPLSTVKDALSVHAIGGDRRFRRARFGTYGSRLAGEVTAQPR